MKDHLAARAIEVDDQIALADRAAAGKDDDVRAGAGVERGVERVDACPGPARCGSAMPPCAATTAPSVKRLTS